MTIPVPSPITGNIYKLLLFINGVNAGASEEYYFTATQSSFDDIFTGLKSFFTARSALLNFNSTSLVGARIGLFGNNRQTKLYYFSQIPQAPTRTNAAEYPALGWLCASVDPSGVFKRSFTLRFVDQTDDTYGASAGSSISPVPSPDFLKLFQVWRRNILNGGSNFANQQGSFQFLIRGQYAGAPTATVTPVYAVAIDLGTGGYKLSTTIPYPGGVGDRVTVTGFRGPNIRGLNEPGHIVSINSAVGSAFVTVTNTPKQPGTPIVTKYGGVVQRPYNFFAISDIQLVRITTHRTGRPFFVTRGRRPSR
jgi:hypothetical protein